MEGIIFSDGSRVVYLPAGYYLISSDAEVTRVKTPEPGKDDKHHLLPTGIRLIRQEDSEHEEDSEEHHDQHPHHQEARDQSEDLGGQASEIYEWNDDGDAGVSDTPRPHDRHAADYPPLADMPSTPSGPYYMDEELENEEDVETTNAPPSNHPTLGCFTLPPQTYQAMALNQPNTRDKYVARGLLSDNLMSHIDAVPYDPFWIFHYGADLTVLTTFRSRMKMEVMFGKAVFRPGDVFRRVAVTGAILTETEAIVSRLEHSHMSSFRRLMRPGNLFPHHHQRVPGIPNSHHSHRRHQHRCSLQRRGSAV